MASIFTVGGTVQAGAGRYIPRRVDDELLARCREGTFAYVLTARQMGKSSLMIRTAERLSDEGIRSVIIDLSQIGVQITDEAWYLGLVVTISRRLRLRSNVFQWWKAHEQLGFAQRMTQFFQEVLLEEVDGPVVIFIDEIDSTLSLPFTDDFFAAIRYVYNARSNIAVFKRLSFVLVGVATPSDLISDPRRTPFNVGEQADVDYFTLEEAAPLAGGFDLPPEQAEQVLRWVFKWTAGHPFLTQRLCAVVAEQYDDRVTEEDVDRAMAATFLGHQGEQDSNLRFVHDMLTRRAEEPMAVLSIYRDILRGRRVPDDRQSLPITHLKLSGIIARKNGRLAIRNPIYAAVFDAEWVKKAWPEHWIRRVPPAVLGLVAAGFVALLLLGLVLFQTQRASQAERESTLQAEANDELRRQVAISDSLKALEEEAARELADQFQVADSLRQQEAAANRRLAEQVQLAEMLRAQAEAARDGLAQQFQVSDSLNAELSVRIQEADSLRGIAETRLDDASAARLETITIALASTAQRQLRRGDAALGALLARQAYLFSRDGEGEFLAPIYDALVQTLNDLDDAGLAPAGGPEVVTGLGADVRAVAYSPDGRWTAAAGADGAVHLWPAGDPAARKPLDAHRSAVRTLAFSPDGSRLVTGGDDQAVVLWESLGAERPARRELGRHDGGVWVAAFSPDGQHLATAGADGRVMVWNLNDPSTPELVPFGGGRRVRALAFHPSDDLLAIGGEGGGVALWYGDASRGMPLNWNAGQGSLHALTFSPDGALLASGGDSLTVRLWRLTSDGAVADVLRGHEGPVHALAFSPDGTLLASGSADRNVQVWDVGRLETSPLLLQGHTDWVWSVAFRPDGTTLATAGADRTVRLWNVRPDALAARVCDAVAGRDLGPDEWSQFVGDDFSYDRYQPCAAATAESN